MAITTQILNDNQLNTVVKIDGTLTAEQGSAVTIVTASSLFGSPTNLKVKRIVYNVKNGLTVNLFWDGGTPATLLNCSQQGEFAIDGADGHVLITNNAATPNGNITLTTTGYVATTSDRFTIVLELIK